MLTKLADLIASKPIPSLILLIVVGGILIWACLFILLRYLLAYRKFTNNERMQMIEAGQSGELLKSFESQQRRNRFMSLSLGLFVPCTALSGATLVTICTHEFAISIVAWICAAIACVASTICGTIVMLRQCDLD
jgi:hypothetical protein